LQRVAGALARHIALRDPVQLIENQGHQFFHRALITLAPGPQKLRDVIRPFHGDRIEKKPEIRIAPSNIYEIFMTVLPAAFRR
jgi:hypothetical protein